MLSKRNHKVYRFLRAHGYSRGAVVAFLLGESGSCSRIARELNVSRSFVSQVIAGKRDSKRVKDAISRALGFDPWA